MNEEDFKNLTGWLQAILKEVQEARGAAQELRPKIDALSDVREHIMRGAQDSNDSERKIEETRNHLDAKIEQLERQMNDMRSLLNDIRSKVDRIK